MRLASGARATSMDRIRSGRGSLRKCSAQFIELRRPGIRSRIFLDSFQARRRKVEIAAITVLNLDVILDNLVLLDLLDAPVNAESVALMHHIIADRKLGKALDLLTLVGGLFLLFPPPSAAEHVSLGNHDELNQRIFKSMQFFSKKGLVFFLTWVYDKCVNYIRQYLQGRVKFPIGGIVRDLCFCTVDPVELRDRQ